MKLVMTLLVRNSEELLRSNLEFHLRQGVAFFVITDNLSDDGTPAIIAEYVRAGLAEGISEPEDTFSQARWVTRMARRAATHHAADWVINNDDDEFWRGRGHSLLQVLEQTPDDVLALEVSRHNHPPLTGVEGAGALARMVYCERTSFNAMGGPLPAKVCHRADPDIEIGQGNHAISRGGAPLPAVQTDALRISHFPLRGYAAFERKIALGGAAYGRNTELDPGVGATWRQLHQLLRQGRLRDWFDQQVLCPARVREGIEGDALVFDDAVAQALGLIGNGPCVAKA